MGKFETENDLRLTIKAEEKEILVDEVCCTSVNIILKNDGQIMTSFLGAHNPEIIKNLEKALKLYFKGIKKTLKSKYKDNSCCCGDENCNGECHNHEGHECNCGDDCHCHSDSECDCHNDKDCHGKEKHNECHCEHEHKKYNTSKKSVKTKTTKTTKPATKKQVASKTKTASKNNK